jgi:hypothetical protein
LKFDVYGRFRIEVAREGEAWVAYLLEPGKRIKMPELAIPKMLAAHEIATFIDDLYHEKSRPGDAVRLID